MFDELLQSLNDDLNNFAFYKRFSSPLIEIIRNSNINHNPDYHLNDKQIKRILDCGSYLDYLMATPKPKLTKANFCGFRFCRLCTVRKSRKLFNQLDAQIKWIRAKYPKYRFLFLTVTVPDSGDLQRCFDILLNGLRSLWQSRRFRDRRGIVGYFSSVEILYHPDKEEWHPHAHVLLCVDDTYFRDNYLNNKAPLYEWCKVWTEAVCSSQGIAVDLSSMEPFSDAAELLSHKIGAPVHKKAGLPLYIAHVEVPYLRRDYKKNSLVACTLEAAKYSVKFDTVFCWSDLYYSSARYDEMVPVLKDRVLFRRGGVFKEAYKDLKQTNPEDDLLHLADPVEYDIISDEVISFAYSYKLRCYVSKKKIKKPGD